MIVDLPDTTVSKISRALVSVREEGGAVALGRVLTLLILTREGAMEEVIEAANDASREHPMRVIVLLIGNADDSDSRLDAQIRVGGDAGASEVVTLRVAGEAGRSNLESLVTGLLLPDAPVVVWWPNRTPENISETSIGRIAQRRITDAATKSDPSAWVAGLGEQYAPGDTDLAWTRLTRWREQLAAILDQPPYEPVTAVRVRGASDSPSTALLAAWLRLSSTSASTGSTFSPTSGRTASSRSRSSGPAERSCSSGRTRTRRSSRSPASPATSWPFRAARCVNAWPRSSVASIPTSCMVE
nr:hypothetical protein GCM10025699_25210 [Microbacterium flavescens]